MRNIGKRKNGKVKEAIFTHIKNNLREYAIITIIFMIGIIFGVIFVNNSGQTQADEISSYINSFISSLKDNAQINKVELLKDALISNFILALSLWFVGSTVIGIPIVYGVIAYRGFCLGYTISASVASLGTRFRNLVYIILNTISKYFIHPMYCGISS